MVNNKCVFDIEHAKSHPYNYCIAPPDEIAGNVPDNIDDCNKWGTNCIKSHGKAMLKYIGNGFFTKSKNILSSDCGKIYGNKYVVKTNNYCTYNGEKVPRYRYINNTRYKTPLYEKEGSKIENTEVGGLITPIIGSGLPKLAPENLFLSNTFDTQGTDLECKRVNMKCHIIDRKNTNKNTSENSGCVYIPKHELDLIKNSEYNECINDATEEFSNLEQAKNLFNSQNNKLNDDENINNIYYLLLSLLIIYLLFKLLNKKNKKIFI